jgi:hypothetical protein
MSNQASKTRKPTPEAQKHGSDGRHKADRAADRADAQQRDTSADEVEPDGLSNADEFPMASVGSASGLQPSGMSPGGSPAAGAGSLGSGGGSTAGAATGSVRQAKNRRRDLAAGDKKRGR